MVPSVSSRLRLFSFSARAGDVVRRPRFHGVMVPNAVFRRHGSKAVDRTGQRIIQVLSQSMSPLLTCFGSDPVGYLRDVVCARWRWEEIWGGRTYHMQLLMVNVAKYK